MSFDRFTDGARKSMALARKEALGSGHDFIGTEHVLLGLLQVQDAVTGALEALGITVTRARAEVEKRTERGHGSVVHGSVPFTPRAKQALELAFREAKERGDRYIGTEHLLLGLLREEEDIAGEVLRALGLTLEAARAEVSRLRPAYADSGAGSDRPSPGERECLAWGMAGSIRFRVSQDAGGWPSLTALDASGLERATLTLQPDGSLSIEVRDKAGGVVFKDP